MSVFSSIKMLFSKKSVRQESGNLQENIQDNLGEILQPLGEKLPAPAQDVLFQSATMVGKAKSSVLSKLNPFNLLPKIEISPEEKAKHRWQWLLGYFALGCVMFLCFWYKKPLIEKELSDKAQAILAADTMYRNVKLKVDGRDFHLLGTVPTLTYRNKVSDTLGSIEGLRSVFNWTTIDSLGIGLGLNSDSLLSGIDIDLFGNGKSTAKGKVVYFDLGGAEISPKASQTLDSLIPLLNKKPADSVVIEGNTDAWGTPKRNQRLSERRATVVKQYLQKQGISNPQRIQIIGKGISDSLASNLNDEGRKANRHVRIKLVSK